jgi:anti-anti-sigma factor
MKLATEVFGEVVVAHAPEELSGEQAERLGGALSSLERRRVVFDLDHAELIDSAGLTALVDAQDALLADGGDLKIASTNAINRKILEITRLDQRLEIFESVVDAVRSFG